MSTGATRRLLGRSGVEVSRVGMGVMTWGERRLGPAQAAYGPSAGRDEEAAALEACREAGVTLLDTAAMYSGGESERRLGSLVADRPGSFEIATKFSPSPWQLAGSLPRELDRSLARLGARRVALYQVHFPHPLQPIAKVMGHLAEAKTSGRALAVGVSNYSEAQLREAHARLADRGVPLASNQVEYSLLERAPEKNGVLDACRELGVTLIAYSPLAMGALSGKYRGGSERARGIRGWLPRFRASRLTSIEPLLGALDELARAKGCAPAAVALRWLVEDDAVLPIPGAKNAAQARTNAAALAITLTRAEREGLTKLVPA